MEAWYPGEEDGNVVAEALFGINNFSGKMPVTFGKTDREAAYESQEQYPGNKEDTGSPGGIGRDPIPGEPQRVVRYTEGLKMGYRWYQATGTKPLFPFGYGESYTTFDYSDLKVDKIRRNRQQTGLRVGYTVTNTGDVAGKEASQVYLRLPVRPARTSTAWSGSRRSASSPARASASRWCWTPTRPTTRSPTSCPRTPTTSSAGRTGSGRHRRGTSGSTSADPPRAPAATVGGGGRRQGTTKAPSRIQKPTVRPSG